MGVALLDHVARVVVAGSRRLFTGVLLPFRHELSVQLRSAFEEMAAALERGIRETMVGGGTAEEIRALAREALVLTPILAPALTQFWLADAGMDRRGADWTHKAPAIRGVDSDNQDEA